MRLAMTFTIELYDFAREEGGVVVSTPGDYVRMQDWVDENMPECDKGSTATNLRINLVLAWQALRREDRLAEFGLVQELDMAAIDDALDHLSVFVEEYGEAKGEGASPLPGSAGPR